MGLQFSWIEVNLLGFFLVDVRNSREKFVINPAAIASQSSLNAGGGGDHDELEIFHEICLIHFTNRSKVEEQEGKYMLLKGILAEKSWPIDAVVGAIPLGGVVASIP